MLGGLYPSAERERIARVLGNLALHPIEAYAPHLADAFRDLHNLNTSRKRHVIRREHQYAVRHAMGLMHDELARTWTVNQSGLELIFGVDGRVWMDL